MKLRTKGLGVLLLSLALVLAFAAAQFQKSVRTVASAGSIKGLPDVAYDAQSERYLVVWQERSGSGGDRDIRARVLDRQGNPVGDIVALASSGRDERLPKTAASGPSSWTVVWTTGSAIEACAVDATGHAGGIRILTGKSARPVDRPDIGASIRDGGLFVVWEELETSGLSAIKGLRLGAADADAGEAFTVARSSDHDLRNPSLSQSGDGLFVAWEKPMEAGRSDIEGRLVPAGALAEAELGGILSLAADGARNTLPSVARFPETDAFAVVWQRTEGLRAPDIAFANVSGEGLLGTGLLADSETLLESRPFASSAGAAGRVLVTYQTSPAGDPARRDIVARTIGWGDALPSPEMAVDQAKQGGINPSSVPAAGAGGRGLVVWDAEEGEGTSLFAKEWLSADLAGLSSDESADDPIIKFADVTIEGQVAFGGMGMPNVLISGPPISVRTDALGNYTAFVPSGWTGTVTPTMPGFAFDPPSRPYADLAVGETGQSYAATYVGGAEDYYEDNDSWTTAAPMSVGTLEDLVLNDQDWFKIDVDEADAGKDLKVRVWGTAFPNTTTRRDLDIYLLDNSGKLVAMALSGAPDETLVVCDVVPGYYYIGNAYVGLAGTVYAVTAELSDALGLGYVTGHVTDDSGTPIEGATVELYSILLDWNVTFPLVVTDASGAYKIGWLPGDYTVRFNNMDFGNDGEDFTPDANYLGEMYNYGEIVSLVSGATEANIDAGLTPGGVITGRITDEWGDPYLNSTAVAHMTGTGTRGSGYTDSSGDYRIDRLPAGNYALRLRTPGGMPLVSEWHDDRTQFADAWPVGVAAGATAAGVDSALQTRDWGTVSGHVMDAYGTPVSNFQVAILDPAGTSLWTIRTDATGFYSFWNIPEGEWKVYFNAASITTPHLVPQYYPDTRFLSEATTIQVLAGEETGGIDALLDYAGTISGQISNSTGGLNVIAFDTASDLSRSVSPATPVFGPTPYTIKYLPPGVYKVLARPSQQGDRIPHWYPDASTYAAAGTVTVTAGATTASVDIALPGGGGTVTGKVTDSEGTPIPGVSVVVLDASKVLGVASMQSGLDGTYTIRQVPPGQVKIQFNTDGPWLNYVLEYYSDKADHESGDLVTVSEGETTTLLDTALARLPDLTVTTALLPAGMIAVRYDQRLEATGGRPLCRWTILSGALPDGLTMSSNGHITGVPVVMGTYPITVQVTDSTLPQNSATQALAITVGAYTGEGFAICGTVTSGGLPLAGVTLVGFPDNPVTSVAGTYASAVPSAWTGTVTPVLAGYAFDPPSIAYANVSANFSGQDYAAAAGHTISGTVTFGGAGQANVLMSGLPGDPRTDPAGAYSAAVPAGWSGTVTPVLPGFTFDPADRTYSDVSSDAGSQDYVSSFVGGIDDVYEDNDSFETAAVLPLGTTSDLVLRDEDWFRVFVPAAGAGKDLKIRLTAVTFPDGTCYTNPYEGKDLDYGVLDASGRLLSYNISGSADETVYICDVAEGWYYIAHSYVGIEGTVYSLTAETNDDFGLAYVSGTVRDDNGNAVAGATVELYSVPFIQTVSYPLVITDAEGDYKIGWTPGCYMVRFNMVDFNDPLDWTPEVNFIGEYYRGGEVLTLAAGTTVTDADGQLTQGGEISGRITDSSGSPQYLARAYAHAGDALQKGGVLTDEDGYFTIDRLMPGNYAVRFRPSNGTMHGVEWSGNESSFASAHPVAVVAGETTAGIDAALEDGGSICGWVTDTEGNPIQNVQVVVYDQAGMSLWTANTLESGGYCVSRLPAGNLKVLFNAATATGNNYVSEYYPDQRFIGDAGTVTVVPGQQTLGVDAVLAAGGAIAGRVTDEAGNGLYNVGVVCADTAVNYTQSVSTDLNGDYTLRNILPGTYKVRFRQTYPLALEWHDNEANFADGDAVTVTAGGTVSGLNAELAPAEGGTVSGQITDGYSGIEGLMVQVQDATRPYSIYSVLTDGDGNYTVANVPSGQVKIYFNTDAAYLGYASEYHADKADHDSADAVTVTTGGTIGIDGALAARPALAVTTTSLPGGECAAGYSQALGASGGRPLYHWTIASGALPNGLTMNSRGEIEGTPTVTGTFDFSVQVTDSTWPQQAVTQDLSIAVGEYSGLGFTISGTVTAEATPLAGVTMSGLPGDPVTNALGGYVAVVPSGWSGTATPLLSGYAFDPAVRTYANVSADSAGQDYAATPGYRIAGTVTFDGAGFSGVLMAGLPGEPRTDAAGAYSMTVPAGWSGTVTPTLPGFTFTPAANSYADVSADLTGQDYVATFAGGTDDTYENNNDFATAAVLPLGTTRDLVLNDEDWFKVYVPAGKDLRVRVWGTSFPDTTTRRDLDFHVLNAAGTALSFNVSGTFDETAYICDASEGWYYIAQVYIGSVGTVYALTAETNADFGIGYVTGTIRDDDGYAVPGATVELYGQPFNWDVSRPGVYTDSAGRYKIAFAPGPYTVQINLTGANDGVDWTPDANCVGETYLGGEVLNLVAGATIEGIDARLSPGGTVTGRITDEAGNPFNMAVAYAYAGDTVRASSVYTAVDGSFSMTRLRTGNYAVRFRAPGGYGLATEWHADRSSFAEALPVPVRAGQTTSGIDASLAAAGGVSGRVTDAEGNAVQGVVVTAYDPAGIALWTGTTDATGNYGFGRLPSGSFKVGFVAASAMGGNFVSEYHPDKRFIAEAGLVAVTAGQTTTGIDATLDPAGTISGRVTDGEGTGLISVSVHAFDPAGAFALGVTTDSLGDYTIRNLPAGGYKVRFRPTSGIWAVEWNDDKADFTGADLVDVAAGSVVDLDAELSTGFGTIAGRVTDAVGTGVANLYVIAQDTAFSYAYTATFTDDDGNYALRSLPTGQAKVLFLTDSTYLGLAQEYYNDRADHSSADAVGVTAGETTPAIDATLAALPALAVDTASLPDGQVAVDYSADLAVSGGRPLYHVSLELGALPPGLSMNARGEIRGWPTAAGTFAFTVRVKDSSAPQQAATRELSLTVGAYAGAGYTISGIVSSGGTPLSGVLMTGLPGEPVTDSLGGYAAIVPSGWSGTVTPSLAGHAFDPATRTYTNMTASLAGQDYAASAGYSISGTVMFGGAGQANVLMSGLPGDPRTGSSGNYSAAVPAGWSGTATPVLPGFTFSPADNSYADVSADMTGQDYASSYVGGVDDAFEDNDSFAAAKILPLGTTPNLVLSDEDWFKFYVPAEHAGKDLRVRLTGTAFPDTTSYRDLDFGVLDALGRPLSYTISGSEYETVYICGVAEGWYYIAQSYLALPGTVYSVTIDANDDYGLAYVTGTIRDDDGYTIAGAWVTLFPAPDDWKVSHPAAFTDASGHYKIGAPPGLYQVDLNGYPFLDSFDWTPESNYVAERYNGNEVLLLEAGTTTANVDVRLTPGGSISGRVTDAFGNPLPQAVTISAYAGDLATGSYALTPGANGNYLIYRLRPGNYAVRARSGSGWAAVVYDGAATFGDAVPVAVSAGATTPDVNFVLTPAGFIQGRVTDAGGSPVQGVTVTAYDPDGLSVVPSSQTDANGDYTIGRLPTGSFKIRFDAATATAGSFVSEYYVDKATLDDADAVSVVAGEYTSGIDAVLAQGGTISGTVTDGGGNPLAAVGVQAFDTAGGFSLSTTTNASGNYTIRSLPGGNYKIRFRPGYGTLAVEWNSDKASYAEADVVAVGAGAVADVDAELSDESGTVTGRVTNGFGAGIAGVTVVAYDASVVSSIAAAVTDGDGYYTLKHFPTCQAKVYFNADAAYLGYASEYRNDKADHASADPVTVTAGSVTSGIDAVLEARPALAVATEALHDGELASPYAATLEASSGRALYRWTIESGGLPPGMTMTPRGEIGGMPTLAGTYVLVVRVTDSTLPQQTAIRELSITVGAYLGEGHAITGRVLSGGAPLAGVVMTGLPGEPVTNSGGGYAAIVPSGWNGTVTPTLSGHAFDPATRTYANVTASFDGQDYTAAAGYSISGTVRLDGVGLAGVLMSGLPGDPRTNEAGSYSAAVEAGWSGTVAPTLPGFTFSPADHSYADVSADQTGQDYVATYAGGDDDPFEDNDSFETAAELPLGTTSDLVLRDEDWFKVYVPAEDAGKDLRVHIWGTSYPDATTRRDLDFYVRDPSGRALSLNLSGSPDETAYICDVVEGWYSIGHTYVGLEGTVYALSLDLNDDFGLGYVEGTVLDDDGAPIPGVSVELYGEPFDWNVSRPLIYTDASGRYKIGYTPGPYTVRFNLAAAERDFEEWTPDANFLGEVYNGGELLQVAPGTTLSGIDGRLTQGGTIAGRVTDASGNPFLNAWVYAHAGDTVTASYNLTDADGNYVLNRLRTGNYAVRFRPTGAAPLATEWYGDAGSFADSIPVPVVAGTVTAGIDAAFGPPGAISGRVTNGTGDPVVNVQVVAYDPAGIALASGYTDGSGNYIVGRLPNGSFLIQFNAAPSTSGNYASEYYADALLIAGAAPVGVTAGQTTADIDAVLAPGGRISGTVTGEGTAIAGIEVHAFAVGSDLYLRATTDAAGAYSIVNVPAGDYKVRFRPTSGDLAVQWYSDKPDYSTAHALAVDVGQDVTGVDVDLSGVSATITGRVTDGLGAGIGGVTVGAQDAARAAAYSVAVTDDEGNYSLGRLPTCQVKLLFTTAANRLVFADEYYNDKADHASADAVGVTAGETTPNIDAALSPRPPLAVTTPSLPDGMLAVGYTQALGASGGRTLYHWSVESGALPDGLAMNARGEITGTPTAVGTFPFTARVADSTWPQQVVTQELTITIGVFVGEGYTISGTVMAGLEPLAGVVMTGLPGEPVTNTGGGYAAVVPDGWTGTATPVLADHIFDPVARPYTNVTASLDGQDFTASLGYTISGIVTCEGIPLEAVLMDGLPGSPLTDTLGYYAAGVPVGWTGTVTPTLAGYTFTPASRSYEIVTANATGQDYAALAVAPSVARVDFNADGQEDILWRYYGGGDYQGLILAWLMNWTETGAPMPLAAARTAAVPESLLTGTISSEALQLPAAIEIPQRAAHTVKNPFKTVLANGKARAPRTKLNLRHPMDLGREVSKPGRAGGIGSRLADITALRDSSLMAATGSGEVSLASLTTSQEVFVSIIPDTGWEIAGTADFDGDGDTDILWRYYGTGAYQGMNDIWYMDGTTYESETIFSIVADTSWRIVGTGDFNLDGHTDILWRNCGTGVYQGMNVIWFMDGAARQSELVFSVIADLGWRIEGTGDFNSDGNTDILWRYYGEGTLQGMNVVWYMNGSTFESETVFSQITDTAWEVGAVGDFDGDGDPDILWRYYGTGAFQGINDIWYMDGTAFLSEEIFSVITDTNWRIANR